jgi:hypothetical protein
MRGQTWWEKVQQRLGVKVAIVGRKSVIPFKRWTYLSWDDGDRALVIGLKRQFFLRFDWTVKP